MNSNQKARTYFLLALVVVAGLVLLPTFMRGKLPDGYWFRPIKLGLDLRGGSYLVLSVNTPDAVKGYLANVAQELRSELRKENVKVLRTKQVGERGIEISLLSREDSGKLESFIRQEYRNFKLASTPSADNPQMYRAVYELSEQEATQLGNSAVDQAIETIRNRVDGFGVAEASIQKGGDNRILVQIPDVTDIGVVKETIGRVAKLEFRLVADPSRPLADTIQVRQREGGFITLNDEVVMTGAAVEGASIDIDSQTHEIGVLLKLTSSGAKTFDRVTGENVGKPFAIVLDGVVQSAPRINERISGGVASITGNFSAEEAKLLTVVLRSGALPAEIRFEEQRVVGATLGADAIRSGVIATLVGAALVVVFMIVYYKKSGLQAVVCTFLNIAFLLALLSTFGATLTLPGIAGLALTLGMAVDANVIIFERIREELRAGATDRAAINAGFDKAHWTILDANITTFLTGLILYSFGTGPIKGFAVTLCLGIFTTVFAALYISRLGYEIIDMRNRQGKLSI